MEAEALEATKQDCADTSGMLQAWLPKEEACGLLGREVLERAKLQQG